MRGKSGTRAEDFARRSDETCERRDAGASNARQRLEKKKKNRSECLLSLLSFRRHQLSVLVVKSSGARERRDTGRVEHTGSASGAALRYERSGTSRSSSVCVTSHSPPLIENLCARIDDDATRTRGCVAGSGVTPRAVRPRRARRGPSSRILRSVWVILGGAHRVHGATALWRQQTDFPYCTEKGGRARSHCRHP